MSSKARNRRPVTHVPTPGICARYLLFARRRIAEQSTSQIHVTDAAFGPPPKPQILAAMDKWVRQEYRKTFYDKNGQPIKKVNLDLLGHLLNKKRPNQTQEIKKALEK